MSGSPHINLDTLAALADEANDGLLGWWEPDDFAEGFPAPPHIDAYLAALCPVRVAALVRAARAAQALTGRWETIDAAWGGPTEEVDAAWVELRAALVVFRHEDNE